MNAPNLFGMSVIESTLLPANVVLLESGDTLYVWNTATGEVRSMPKSDLLRPLTKLWPAPVPGTSPGDDRDTNDATKETP